MTSKPWLIAGGALAVASIGALASLAAVSRSDASSSRRSADNGQEDRPRPARWGDWQPPMEQADAQETLPESVSELTKILRDGSIDQRSEAVSRLAALGTPDALATLVQCSRTAPLDIRSHCAGSLGEFRTPQARRALAELVTGGGRWVVNAAVSALAQDGSDEAMETLLQAARGSRRVTRISALQSLAAMGGPGVDELMSELSATGSVHEQSIALGYMLDNEREGAFELAIAMVGRGREARSNAISALSLSATDGTTDALLTIAESSIGSSRVQALEALTQRGTFDPRVVGMLIESLNSGRASETHTAAHALSQLPRSQGRAALVQAVRSADAQTAQAAMAALGTIGTPEAVDELIAATRSGDATLSQTALSALTQSGSPRAIEAIEGMLESEDPNLRNAAAWSLPYLDTEEANKKLLSLVSAEDANLRQAAIAGLSQDPSNTDALILLTEHESGDTRSSAIRALAQLGTDSAVDRLVDLAGKGDATVRAEALSNLAQSEHPRAQKLLLTAIDDNDASVANAAIWAAQFNGGRVGIERVAARLSDPATPVEVRQTAAQALQNFGGELARQHEAAIADALETPTSPDGAFAAPLERGDHH